MIIYKTYPFHPYLPEPTDNQTEAYITKVPFLFPDVRKGIPELISKVVLEIKQDALLKVKNHDN